MASRCGASTGLIVALSRGAGVALDQCFDSVILDCANQDWRLRRTGVSAAEIDDGAGGVATVSCPGTGAGSEQWGLGSSATGLNSLAVGNGATADTTTTEDNMTAIGRAAVASGNDSTALGAQSTASGDGGISLGFQSTASGSGSIALGQVTAGGDRSVVIGSGSNDGNFGDCIVMGNDAFTAAASCIAIGTGSDAAVGSSVAVGVLAQATANQCTAVGRAAGATGTLSTSIGANSESGSEATALGWTAQATGSSSVALGSGTSATFAESIALGKSSTTTKINQFVMGADTFEISEVVIGNGVTNAAPIAQMLSTTTNGVGVDIHATDLVLAAGRSTGAALPAELLLQTTDVGATGSVLQTLVTRLALTEGVATFTDPVELASFIVAALPPVTTNRMIIVSDETGGLVPAFSDGTNWLRVTDRAIVS